MPNLYHVYINLLSLSLPLLLVMRKTTAAAAAAAAAASACACIQHSSGEFSPRSLLPLIFRIYVYYACPCFVLGDPDPLSLCLVLPLLPQSVWTSPTSSMKTLNINFRLNFRF